MITRRAFLGILVAAPAIVRASSLMPIVDRSFAKEMRRLGGVLVDWEPAAQPSLIDCHVGQWDGIYLGRYNGADKFAFTWRPLNGNDHAPREIRIATAQGGVITLDASPQNPVEWPEVKWIGGRPPSIIETPR